MKEVVLPEHIHSFWEYRILAYTRFNWLKGLTDHYQWKLRSLSYCWTPFIDYTPNIGHGWMSEDSASSTTALRWLLLCLFPPKPCHVFRFPLLICLYTVLSHSSEYACMPSFTSLVNIRVDLGDSILTLAEIQVERLNSRKIVKQSEGSPYRHSTPTPPFSHLYPKHF